MSTRTGIEHEESLLHESAARESSLNTQVSFNFILTAYQFREMAKVPIFDLGGIYIWLSRRSAARGSFTGLVKVGPTKV